MHENNRLHWQEIFRQNFTKLNDLTKFLELTPEQCTQLIQRPSFALNVPLRLAEKMQKGTLEDPILKQFLPLISENHPTPDYSADPVADVHFKITPKMLKKYQGRVLLICTSACAMHCRYCFRQNFNYSQQGKIFEKELEWIAADHSINEVILSGGDPLSLPDRVLEELLSTLASFTHIKKIRFHSRFPIGIPERIDENFIHLIESLNKQIVFVIHVNHVNELDDVILFHLKKLQKLGCVLLNQSVLLKGVNDDLYALKALFEKLTDNGIIPYYLHQLDRVNGSAHFEVEESKGCELIQELSKLLPGYAIPKYVREIPGEPNKTPIIIV